MDVLQPQTTGVLVAGVLSLSLLYWLSTRRPAGLPPGPGPALPLLGHLLLLERDTRAQFRQWRRQYGDVFSYYVGSQLVVVLNGLDVMQEAFVKMADTFSHRPHAFYGDKINEGKGKGQTASHIGTSVVSAHVQNYTCYNVFGEPATLTLCTERQVPIHTLVVCTMY